VQIVLTGLLFVYNLPLLCITEERVSLTEKKKALPISQRFLNQKGTHIIGVVLIVLSIATFDSNGDITDSAIVAFGLHSGAFPLFRIFSSQVLHWNIIHLVYNLSALMLLVGYERRVGFLRYVSVFLMAGIAASVIDLIIYDTAISLGSSAGIAGLVSGYFIDGKEKSTKEILSASLFVLCIISVYSFGSTDLTDDDIAVNWISHYVGAVSAGIFIVCTNTWPLRGRG
jgi:membrane associated rhomboid family serine protease